MKRIPPGQLDRIGRQMERLHQTYIKRWLEKGYIGAEVFDQQFCKLFDMINAEVDGASGVVSKQSMDRYSREESYEPEEEYGEYSRRSLPTPSRSYYPPSGSSTRVPSTQQRTRTSGYQPKSSFYRNRRGR